MTELESGRLLPTKLLAKEIIKTEEKVGSIYKPITVKDPNVKATIVLKGDGVTIPIDKGNTIIFSPHSFQRVRLSEEDFLVLDYRDVLFYY